MSALGKTILSLCDVERGCIIIRRKLLHSVANKLRMTQVSATIYCGNIGVWVLD